jgi:hypothetical protein
MLGVKSPVTSSHIGDRSVSFMIHVINQSPTSTNHVRDEKPTTARHVGGIYSVEKHRWIGRKPKFSYNLCKGDNLTHMCLGISKA